MDTLPVLLLALNRNITHERRPLRESGHHFLSVIQFCSTAELFRRVDQEHSLPGPHRSAVSFSPQLDATHPLLDRNCCFDAGTFSSSSHLVLRSSDPTSRANCPNMHAASSEKVELPQAYRTIVQDNCHGATLDDIEHTISNAVIDSVVRKS